MATMNETWPGFERGYRRNPAREVLRRWSAELAAFPGRWRRAAQVGFVTAVGAAIFAMLQIVNPLGLTLLVSMGAPEFAFDLATAGTFLIGGAGVLMLTLFIVGALVDNPVMLVCAFIALCGVSTYLIYAIPRIGRLWIWIQIPVLAAFYNVVFDHRGLGWETAQMYAGLVIAVALLWVFNHLVWPQPAASVLQNSLSHTLGRSRTRLERLIAIFLGERAPEDDREIASKLAYHLSILGPAIRGETSLNRAGAMLAKVVIVERINNEIDNFCVFACRQTGRNGNEAAKADLRSAVHLFDRVLEEFGSGASQTQSHVLREILQARLPTIVAGDSFFEVYRCLERIADLLGHQDEMPDGPLLKPARTPLHLSFRLNGFLLRFSVRHTVAMTIAFMAGMYDNNAALHAALWLLMIGGPPSHGATPKKFIVRAIGSISALVLAVLATIVLAPNFTSLPPYTAAIFVGVAAMTYLGEGGGELSFLGIGATAFAIAFSGPGPRPEVIGSIWTIWGISFGMVVRAIISAISIEHPSRTLAEEMQRPLRALIGLVPRHNQSSDEIAGWEVELIGGMIEMLAVAADAQLAGRAGGIDDRELIAMLDTVRRMGFLLGNLSYQEEQKGAGTRPNEAAFFDAIRMSFESWLDDVQSQIDSGRVADAPLRHMVSSNASPLMDSTQNGSEEQLAVSSLLRILEQQFASIRIGG